MTGNRQALRIIALFAALAGSFYLLLLVGPWRAELAETNYQANLIRLQTFLFAHSPKSVLVGSSLSGRLLPRYFHQTQLAPIANLGLDGSGPLFGLDIVLRQPPPVILVEANILLQPHDANDDMLAAATESVGFRLARYVPLLRADARPSSILYTWFKLRRKTATANPAPAPAPPRPNAFEAGEISAPNPKEQDGKEKLRAQFRALQQRGCRVILVRLPTGWKYNPTNHPSLAFADELAHEFNLPQLDLLGECSSRGQVLSYTDGLHLTPAAAQEVSRVLAQLVPAQ